jgi:2Fe-2S ferredoxin
MKYRMTVRPSGEILEIDPVALEAERDGRTGSILQALLNSGIDMDHACGGVGACSTCHVIVSEGGDTIPEADENEEDCLESARGLTLQSRLACQAVPDGSKDLVVEIPSWNINEVKESH